MTEQSPNDVFHASSFLQGTNADYIEQLHARYAENPSSVDEAWQEFFRSLGDSGSVQPDFMPVGVDAPKRPVRPGPAPTGRCSPTTT